MADTSLDDSELSLAIEQALAPFTALLPAATFDCLRREMAIQLCAHPHSAALLRQLRPDPKVHESGPTISEEARASILRGAPGSATSAGRGRP